MSGCLLRLHARFQGFWRSYTSSGGIFSYFCANGFFHEKVGFLLFRREMKHRLVELMNRKVFVKTDHSSNASIYNTISTRLTDARVLRLVQCTYSYYALHREESVILVYC